MNTANEQGVGSKGDDIVILLPKIRMTKEEALVHAAWLVAVAADDRDHFLKILEEVENA